MKILYFFKWWCLFIWVIFIELLDCEVNNNGSDRVVYFKFSIVVYFVEGGIVMIIVFKDIGMNCL